MTLTRPDPDPPRGLAGNLLLAGALSLVVAMLCWSRCSGQHPAVCRLKVPDRSGVSYGTGALIAKDERWCYILTAHHVVEHAVYNQARRQPSFRFPDGSNGYCVLVGADATWDLALLRGYADRVDSVDPLPLASSAPNVGEVLTIHGYGSGQYRSVPGRVLGYVAPSRTHPFEWVEMSPAARDGDSGGPLLNEQGELAAVLWGANRIADRTTGTVLTSAKGSPTGATQLTRLRTFLGRVCPDCVRPRPRPPVVAPPVHPTPPTQPPVAEPEIDYERIFAWMLDNREKFRGEPGEDGRDGKDGKDGLPGPPGKVTIVRESPPTSGGQTPAYFEIVPRRK